MPFAGFTVDGRQRHSTHPQKSMIIYEKGRKVIVEVADSKIASLIGEYHDRVKQFLETRKELVSERNSEETIQGQQGSNAHARNESQGCLRDQATGTNSGVLRNLPVVS